MFGLLFRRAFATTTSASTSTSSSSNGLSKWLLVVPVVTFGLGTWQIARKKQKEELIEFFNAKLQKEAVLLPEDVETVSGMKYERVFVEGEFLHDKEIVVAPKTILREAFDMNMSEENIGAHIVTPFRRKDNGRLILVNRGFVPTVYLDPKRREEGQVKGTQKLVGIVSLGEKQTSFVPDNKPEEDSWLWSDLLGMAKFTGSDPIMIDAVAECTPKFGLPIGGQTRISIRNEHMQYILTWYSLSAATLALWFMSRKMPSLSARRLPPSVGR
eukprot:m.35503 g.35503  ORF g.35503 m.35503 type:complete len:271 (-) comp10027_c0_seq2:119-931(-)